MLATGSDGYRVVFSMGELSPAFGNRPDLVATQETIAGKTAPLAADGLARATAPGDAKGGRYVSNLASLSVRASGSTTTSSGGGHSDHLAVDGAVVHAGSFDLAALKALPATTETVGGVTYTGVSLWDLLNGRAGIVTDPAVKNDILDKYVVATGSDGYRTLLSMGRDRPRVRRSARPRRLRRRRPAAGRQRLRAPHRAQRREGRALGVQPRRLAGILGSPGARAGERADAARGRGPARSRDAPHARRARLTRRKSR